jgi:hypothetical protein
MEARISLEGPRLRVTITDGPRFLLAPVSPTRFRVVGQLGTFVVFEIAGPARRLLVEENGETSLTLKSAPN